jgi:hypothetical protein
LSLTADQFDTKHDFDAERLAAVEAAEYQQSAKQLDAAQARVRRQLGRVLSRNKDVVRGVVVKKYVR